MSLPGPLEIMVVLLVALIVLGPERLGMTARQAGRYYKEFRSAATGVQTEMRDLFDEATREEPEVKVDGVASNASSPDSTVDTDQTVAGAAPQLPTSEVSAFDPIVVRDSGSDTEADATNAVVDSDVVKE